MLNNLKGSYFRRKDYGKVLMLIEMGLAIDPASRQEIHDRGMVCYLLRRYPEALADLQTYLNMTPADDPQTKDAKSMIHRIRAMFN